MPVLLNGFAADRPVDEAIVDDAGAVNWAGLAERVNRWVALLTGHGLVAGDRLACLLGNRREAFELLLGCLHAGVVLVPVNWHLTGPEIGHILRDSGSRGLVVEPAYAAAAAAALPAAGARLRLLLVTGDRAAGRFAAAGPLLAAAAGTEPAGQTCGSVMLYTSGTTGAPKGVVNGLFEVGAPFARVGKLAGYARVVLQVAPRARFLLDGPWYHSSQLFFALLALLQGARLAVRGRFDPVATLRLIDQQRITATHLVPTQFVRLLRLPEEVRRRFSGASLDRVWHGGGPCPVDVKRQMVDWWGPVFLEYYGATEGGAVTLIDSYEWLRRPGSVGRAVPPNELVVVGPDGDPLPAGRAGRVFVRRRDRRSFHYHNAPEKTRSAHLAPDTFTYGELGYLDDAGYLYLTGRAQDLIVTGGVNVYPAEVEAVLLTHPAVRDAAVVGVADDEFGERVVAVVEPEPGAPDRLAAALDAHCRRSLAGFKVPRAYRLVAALPREATGKIRKELLRDQPSPTGTDSGSRDAAAA